MSNKTSLRSIVSSEVGNLPSSVPINKDRYSLRVKSAVFGNSKSSGNPMITVVSEIYSPESIVSVRDGKTYNVAGVEITGYYSLTEKALPKLAEFMEACGMPAEIDLDNPDVTEFIGKCYSQIVGSEERQQRKELTESERALGKKFGDPILREDGSPEISYTAKGIGSPSKTSKVAPAGVSY